MCNSLASHQAADHHAGEELTVLGGGKPRPLPFFFA